MPRLSPDMQRRAQGAIAGWYGPAPARRAFLNELLTGRAYVHIGPRGGRTWGEGRLPNASFQVLQWNLWDRGLHVLVDENTRRVHLVPAVRGVHPEPPRRWTMRDGW